jgi:competence protein ComEC
MRLAGTALAWLAGVALQLQEPALQVPALYWAAAGGGVAGLVAAWRWPRAAALALVGAALLGYGATGGRAALRLAQQLPPEIEGRDLVVTGVVASLPQRGSLGVRFRFEVESALADGAPVTLPPRIAVGWYTGVHEDAVGTLPPYALRAGERWRFTLRLRRPHGNLNPHGFDYELLLFEQGVRATATVRPAPATRLAAAAGQPVERLRQDVRDAIERTVADQRAAGVLAALAVGDQGAIARDDWDLFRNTGVAHLMSISGLHVTMFAWLAGALVGAAWRRSAWSMLWLPAPLAARWGGLALAGAYAVLAGFGVPAQRTLLMLATVVLLPGLGARWPWPLALLAAATVVTAFDPWAMLQPGFWLSFVAVGLLMASTPAHRGGAVAAGRTRLAAWLHQAWALLRGGLRTQVVATLGLAPLTLVFFQQISFVGFIANLVAIPLVTLVVTPLALLGGAVAAAWTLAAWLVQRLALVLESLAGWPGAVWTAAAVPTWAQWAALAGGAVAVLPLPWRLRALALLPVLPLLWPVPDRPPPGRFELLAVDVGQGTAVLVRTRTRLLVVDAGPQYGPDSDAGQRLLLPLLRARGERRIDLLLLSHRDTDHVGGAAALLRALPVAALSSSLDADHPLRAAGAPHRACEAGQRWDWDGVRFELLHPPPGEAPPDTRSNARSCVLRVEGEGGSALLTGDIEREQELALVDRFGDALRADVLVVPHHGSRTSSTAPFLDAVRPAVAVIQAGYRNRFGHPAADVVARYRERGTVLHVSPGCGAWRWDGIDGAAPQGVCQRDAARRYWHHAPAAPP